MCAQATVSYWRLVRGDWRRSQNNCCVSGRLCRSDAPIDCVLSVGNWCWWILLNFVADQSIGNVQHQIWSSILASILWPILFSTLDREQLQIDKKKVKWTFVPPCTPNEFTKICESGEQIYFWTCWKTDTTHCETHCDLIQCHVICSLIWINTLCSVTFYVFIFHSVWYRWVLYARSYFCRVH